MIEMFLAVTIVMVLFVVGMALLAALPWYIATAIGAAVVLGVGKLMQLSGLFDVDHGSDES